MLGPLEVRRDGQSVELRGAKRRALLALLILHANEVVRTDRLVDELWGEHRRRTHRQRCRTTSPASAKHSASMCWSRSLGATSSAPNLTP